MKKLFLSTILATATAGFAFAQDATTTPPATDGDTQAPLTGENMTPTNPPAADTGTGTGTMADPAVPTAPATPETTNPDMATTSSREGYSPVMTEAVTSENLTGANVYTAEDDDVGTVSELVLDDQGKVTQVIVDVGGFLGIGAKPVALTMTELEILQEDDGDDIRAYTTMTREELEALPEYEG
ncbi:PRC-barrel domain-containing protein [Cereibacter sp. SYSU M97828]|nr:PRC-barrel domain-containing protein [Cereibacter flavus]